MNQLPRISTPAIEGQFQAAKWLKIQALIDEQELAQLLAENFFIYPLSGMFSLSDLPMKKEAYLHTYATWIQDLKKGKIPSENREMNAVAWVPSSDAIWLQQVPNDRYLVKPCKPFVQVQVHQMGYSPIDQEFRPMILSQDCIFWGLQFSFPQVYQDPKTNELKETKESDLFQALRKWIRNNTLPTPMLVQQKKVNLPIRLGKSCLSWINQHPQLRAKGLTVQESYTGS